MWPGVETASARPDVYCAERNPTTNITCPGLKSALVDLNSLALLHDVTAIRNEDSNDLCDPFADAPLPTAPALGNCLTFLALRMLRDWNCLPTLHSVPDPFPCGLLDPAIREVGHDDHQRQIDQVG